MHKDEFNTVVVEPQPDLKPLYVNLDMVEQIERWASNAVTHGNLEAWAVLSVCLEWRCR